MIEYPIIFLQKGSWMLFCKSKTPPCKQLAEEKKEVSTMTENTNREELMALVDRLIHLRYSMDSDHLRMIFSEISMPDYMILMMLARKLGIHEPDAKVYLSEISTEIDRPINQVSKLVQNLQNKGYVYWKHDDKGENGTYIYLSEIGQELIEKQQGILLDYFKRIIDNMGYERFVSVLNLMIELEDAMKEEAEKM